LPDPERPVTTTTLNLICALSFPFWVTATSARAVAQD
jgi:hypothetical protein